MNKTNNAILINSHDNVAVVLTDIKSGDRVMDVVARCDIPVGHKIAIKDIASGGNIIKYGSPIGSATTGIKPGEHIHTHNMKTKLASIEEYTYNPKNVNLQTKQSATFSGFERPDGQVGIRNEIWIINTVGCVNKTAELIVQKARASGKTDDIYTFSHPYGCSQLGDDHVHTRQTLINMVNHPNAAGVLVLGLGCENNNIEGFKQALGSWDDDRVKFLNTQDVSDEVSEGIKLVDELVAYAATYKRTEIPASKLIVGLKCGGSDGFSGITANVLVGSFTDLLISQGGTCILTEVPEMFGAETLLLNRAKDKKTFDKIVSLINDFKQYFIEHDQEIYENPSPGNKEGGISTLEEKSIGCTQKGGNSHVVDVLNYGETVKQSGLNLLQGPGNDLIAVTNLMAAGAHIVLFTTGRGTPYGGPVPTVKISSNTALSKKKSHWNDFNAGVLLDGEALSNLTDSFFKYILSVAEGSTKTQNELNGYREISIFKSGVTL